MFVSDYQRVARIFIKADVPLRVWGSAGIGKSKILQQIAKEMGYHFVDLRLATQEVGDLIGIPYTHERTGADGTTTTVTSWAQPNWLYQIWEKHHEGIPTILAMEEKTRAPKEVTQAAFQILTEKKIHEHSLPSTTRLFALDNPPTDEYDVATSDRAENTRWGNIYVQSNPDDWIEGYAAEHMSPELVSFIVTNKDSLMSADKTTWDVETVIYKTPRTWELGNRIWTAHQDTFDPKNPVEINDMKISIGSCVGIAAASEFVESVLNDWVSPEDILSGKSSYETIREAPAQVLRLYYQFLLYLTNEDLRNPNDKGTRIIKTRVENLGAFIEGLVDDERKDLAIGLLKNLASKKDAVSGKGARNKILPQLFQYASPKICHMVGELSQSASVQDY